MSTNVKSSTDPKKEKDEPKTETKCEQNKSQSADEYNNVDPVTDEHLKLFPERRGGDIRHTSFLKDLRQERDQCEFRTLSVLKNYPLVKLLERAMKAHGCELDYRRHFSCEPCNGKTTGGYDVYYNQIVVCSNKYMNKGQFMGTIGHEMIHMFDACRAKLDFNNPEHVACTEIRAANLMHCSIPGSIYKGTTPIYRWADTQKECVREKAFLSLISSLPDLDHSKAYAIVDKVFDKCYNDMEPFGRHIQSFKDSLYAYRERYLYGYP
ncbi:mitochondrial inner membrane protease ATP23 homolog [Panonychus citri]|uniref:mitochondrial inner membrane protease ATP23 homolog n=1 Tax=Panonychus citri TaxID=50023 RepID=UPI00230735CE|nr:mitochondrial inner membrane protease ATP23 homolog [Panonychus citri]